MKLTEISPDQQVFLESGVFKLNATIVFTWLVMAVLIGGSWLVTRKLSTTAKISRWQNFLEIAVVFVADQIREVTGAEGRRYLPFVATLFLFVALCNVAMIVPGYVPPTASLSTTVALALSVFVAVPFFGIGRDGLKHYFSRYLQPTVFMLPFNIIGELSRTLALAVRLFGNMMSGTKIAAILLAITPLLFPAIMNAFGLLTGMVQAYIFSILALVYIASGGSPDNSSSSLTSES